MPARFREKERLGIDIVRREEAARGWIPEPLLPQKRQREEGCDFFSTPPDGGPQHPVEVKAWGESLFDANGAFTYPADINVQQFERAQRDPHWRLEIVANLDAVQAGTAEIERLTLSASEVLSRARPWRINVDLDDLARRVRRESLAKVD